jgi:hypothetical protein
MGIAISGDLLNAFASHPPFPTRNIRRADSRSQPTSSTLSTGAFSGAKNLPIYSRYLPRGDCEKSATDVIAMLLLIMKQRSTRSVLSAGCAAVSAAVGAVLPSVTQSPFAPLSVAE